MIDHVSDLQWDRLLAGELTAEAGEVTRVHAGDCAACAARLRQLSAERDAFLRRPAGFSYARPTPRAHRRWAAALLPVLAAAVVVMIVRARPDPAGERPKGGGPTLLLAAGHPGALVPVASGDLIRPRAYLQAGYTAARDGFGAVLARDGAGAVMAYVPRSGDAMVPLPAGTEQSFPHSTVLDDVVGDERIVIVWCEAPHPVAPMLAALRAGQAIARPAGCALRDVVLDKRAAAR